MPAFFFAAICVGYFYAPSLVSFLSIWFANEASKWWQVGPLPLHASREIESKKSISSPVFKGVCGVSLLGLRAVDGTVMMRHDSDARF